jgi:cob(I)alamin adenosyltransferase
MNRTGKTDKLSVKLANNKIMMMEFEGLIGQARNFLKLDKIPKDMKDLMEPIKEDVIELCRYLKQTENNNFIALARHIFQTMVEKKSLFPKKQLRSFVI